MGALLLLPVNVPNSKYFDKNCKIYSFRTIRKNHSEKHLPSKKNYPVSSKFNLKCFSDFVSKWRSAD